MAIWQDPTCWASLRRANVADKAETCRVAGPVILSGCEGAGLVAGKA